MVKSFRIKHIFIAILAITLLSPPAIFAQRGQQKIDREYTEKILEYTTDKCFLTELVDHLPASDKVPTPMKILGNIIGAPDILHYTADINRYMRELDKASPRVKVFSLGMSDEGREMILVAVSEESNIKRLTRLKGILARLADPRGLSEAEADKLIAQGLPIYWITGGMHSPETGSCEMLMELAYRLAVEETDFIKAIRKNLVVLMTPVLEVDGRDRQVDVYRYKKENQGKTAPPLIYWGKYVGHDNNRDAIGLVLKLTENVLKGYLEWHPIVMHDLHESIPFLYTSTGTGPYNAWLDPIAINEWQELAYVEISEMTKRGVPGVWTHGFFDGWAPGYAYYIAQNRNSIGRFYETFGGMGADTQVRNVGAQARRAWYRPNPPLEVVKWSFRNNINLQQSALLFALKHVADNKAKFLRDFYRKSQRSVAKARTEGPAAWVIPADEPRLLAAANLVNHMRKHGAEVHQAEAEFTVKEGDFPTGSYIIRMDQPYSRCVDMLLDTQYYNPNDPRPYDDTGWTLGPLYNVKTVRVVDTEVLEVPMTLLNSDVKVEGKLVGERNAAAFLINHSAENALMTLRYRLKDVNMLAAERSFKVDGIKYNAGSFIIPTADTPVDFVERLEKELNAFGLTARGVSTIPKVKTHQLAAPRIAILHTWLFTQNEGWYRLTFEKLGIPYHYISPQVIRDTEDLKSRYDVIIFPPVMFGKAQRLVNGIGGTEPIPWKKTPQYPHLGGPDSIDDIRGGIETKGILHLRRFVEEGGLFIPITTNASLPIDYGMVESVMVVKPEKLKTQGAVFNARVTDIQSPIIYGYGRELGVYFGGAPVLEAGMRAVLGDLMEEMGEMLGAEVRGRPSGRGSLKDPDVIQGRPYKPTKVRGAGTGIPEEYREMFQLFMPPDLNTVRVVMRFDRKDKLLISGMLDGAEELANRPAVVDVPLGKGHIVFFAINPMWRFETHGSFFLLFNAALNYQHLDAGRPKPQPAEPK